MKVPYFIRRNFWRLLYYSRFIALLPDRAFTKLLYWVYMGKFLNLDSPLDFNQKIQWLKLYYRDHRYITCADKYAVRSYVAEKIGEEYLNKCIGVYSSVEEIEFDKLPNRFVLKATHGSGWNLICSDKKSFNWKKACRKMRRWLKSDFSKVGREWQYHLIKPQIICEAFLEEEDKTPLKDYKLFTFKGETKFIALEFDKSDGSHFLNIYNSEWEFQPDKRIGVLNDSEVATEAPKCLKKMIEIARTLAEDFPMCRVDFYVLGGERIVFGELTFTPGKGCNNIIPQSFNDELGSYIECKKMEVES